MVADTRELQSQQCRQAGWLYVALIVLVSSLVLAPCTSLDNIPKNPDLIVSSGGEKILQGVESWAI